MTEVQVYNGIIIDYERDKLLGEQGISLLTRKGFYKKSHEDSPQETFARPSLCYSFGDYEFAQRMYNYASNHWFVNASPVQSNAMDIDWPSFTEDQFEEAAEWLGENVIPEGMPISCFLSYVADTKEGLVEARKETAWLSMMGGGIGIYTSNRSPDEKSTGVMAHLRGYDADALSYKQTESRRGSIAAYLNVDHPEIMSFIDMRNPAGGEMSKKCFNLNNAVNLTDKFMNAVVNGEKYELNDPKHGPTGNFLDAREVFEKILELRSSDTGEPYCNFIDTVNRARRPWITKPTYHVSQSNLCVAPETMILTKNGYTPIAELENEVVDIWNGEEWSEVTVKKTSTNSKLVKVTTDSGQTLECTEYHKFYVQDGCRKPPLEKRTLDLQAGDKLIKFDLPVVEGIKELDKAYQNGFYSGDGCEVGGKSRIYLYGAKRSLEQNFDLHVRQEQDGRVYGYEPGLKKKFFVPTEGYSIKSRLEWLAGFCDADGCVARNGSNESLQLCSVEKGFLLEIQLMLQTLGITSKVKPMVDGGQRLLPANDGSGELKLFDCKSAYRLLISSSGLFRLSQLGLKCDRLEWEVREPNRNAEHFVKVVSVEDNGRYADTYCFKESKRGMGMFGGILTGQCNEIHLMTSEKRTAVCCLSSVNLEKFDEWKDDPMFLKDMVRYLDNVLEYFIRLAPSELKRAIYSAKKERAIGLGTLGFHSYLQSKMIPFESGGFNSAAQVNAMIYSHIEKKAVEASLELGKTRGEPDDVKGSGMRNSHLLAIAPNASSSNIIGVSPSIEPWADNVFSTEGRAGSFLVKNKHLKKLLEAKGQDTDAVWEKIMADKSVRGLDFLTDHEKKVFATAREINPMWIIEHASIRQPHICQGQSVNLFHDNTWSAQEIADVHITAWKKGLKGLYYFRGKAAKAANVGTGREQPLNAFRPTIEYTECIACEG